MWKGGKVKDYTCKQCGVSFRRKQADVWGKNTFCSFSCRSIYTVSHNKTNGTDIERAMQRILVAANIRFEPQKAFTGIGVPDFYLPDCKLAIFCDGEYWHDYPHGKPRDWEQSQKLRAKGVHAVRIWGKDILELDVELSSNGDAAQTIDTAFSLLPS